MRESWTIQELKSHHLNKGELEINLAKMFSTYWLNVYAIISFVKFECKLDLEAGNAPCIYSLTDTKPVNFYFPFRILNL